MASILLTSPLPSANSDKCSGKDNSDHQLSNKSFFICEQGSVSWESISGLRQESCTFQLVVSVKSSRICFMYAQESKTSDAILSLSRICNLVYPFSCRWALSLSLWFRISCPPCYFMSLATDEGEEWTRNVWRCVSHWIVSHTNKRMDRVLLQCEEKECTLSSSCAKYTLKHSCKKSTSEVLTVYTTSGEKN